MSQRKCIKTGTSGDVHLARPPARKLQPATAPTTGQQRRLAKQPDIHRRSICFALVLATVTSWFTLELPLRSSSSSHLFPGVQATLWPKARICFNSMTSSFQSECVYCDSRLYASTITACTGQPVLANNITQAQAFCIATACLQQTGKQPTVLGRRRRRRRRSLQFRPLALGALNINKANKPSYYNSLSPNGNVTAQIDKSLNGTTSGNLAFVLNRPAQALWLNPLSRVLIRNSTNKNLQWQFGKMTASVNAGRGATPPARPPAAGATPPRPAAPAPRPATPAAPAATTARPATAAPSAPAVPPAPAAGR